MAQLASTTNIIASVTMTVNWCGYADDLLLVFDDVESLYKGIKLLDEVFNTWRLRINPPKTKTMILNEAGEYASTIASFNGETLDNVKSYKCLGCEIKFDELATDNTESKLLKDIVMQGICLIEK